MTLDPITKTHPLIIDHVPTIGEVPKVACHVRAEDEPLLALLRKLSKTFSTRDVIEEIVAEDRWIEGIPVPDFAAVFSLRADRKFLFLGSC